MKPSDYCKSKGLSGLKELSVIVKVSEQTLINWYNSKDRNIAFIYLVNGVVASKQKNNIIDML